MLNASPKLSAGQNVDDALLTESIFTSQFRRPGIYLVLWRAMQSETPMSPFASAAALTNNKSVRKAAQTVLDSVLVKLKQDPED